ncbi:MAG: penicillin-binding protein 2 [Armatimonadota bacterium]|nr:penicillin-binding protein 2 [Armatimonadota bacterium]MDR7533970.1 penicillin-binding protein 2 [Armatimonadota bacterium]MDR7536438.1 penicillin-binding protein 2 [Armatimonadota bacterium]
MTPPLWSQRVVRLGAALLALLVLIEGRLWVMQALQGPMYLRLSEQNRLRDYVVPAPRGVLYDRKGRPLVTNRAAFTISVLPMEVKEPGRLAERLAPLVGLEPQDITARIDAGRRRPFEPVPLRRDADKTAVITVEEQRLDLPGVVVQAEPVRDYLLGTYGAHVFGYLGEIAEDELRTRPGYRAGDLIGKTGIERTYDAVLRGEAGRLRVEVDAAGRPMRVLSRETARPGQSLVLTLDADLQAVAEQALGARTGVVVAMDPRTGEILVLVSRPTYDPALFAGGISPPAWRRLTADRHLPLLNRATEGTYEPGSVFKIVTGLAALAEGVATRDSLFHCTGALRLGGWVFRDLAAYGTVNFIRGTAVSCNVMFWTLGRAVGEERLYRYATMLGLGQPTGIDLPAEAAGLVPSAAWKQRVWKEPWYPGDTLNMSIGQGWVLVTPLQIARLMAAVATDGTLVRPRLLRRILTPSGRVVAEPAPQVTGRAALPPSALRTMHEGLRAVVDGGTGAAARVPGLAIAGKTGSAENPRGIPHAWFVGYAPADRPALVVVVFVEHGRRGGEAAAPIARAVFAAASQTLLATSAEVSRP